MVIDRRGSGDVRHMIPPGCDQPIDQLPSNPKEGDTVRYSHRFGQESNPVGRDTQLTKLEGEKKKMKKR
jgi:hypothetical protein